MAQRPSDQPATPTVLDLDKISAEIKEKSAERPPFKTLAGGTEIVFAALDDLDWEEVQELTENFNPREFFYAVIPDDEQLNIFFQQSYAPPVIEHLVKAYFRHYELDMPGEARLNRAARRRRK